MAAKTIEIRAKYNNGITTVNALITHPMDPGSKIGSKERIARPPHFIQKATCTHQNTVLVTAQWGIGIPKNPYLSFSFKGGKKGEIIHLKWVDNRGDSDASEVIIK